MVAAWAQTLTGFALGMILMGGVGALGLMPLPEAATVTALMVALNGALVVRAEHRALDRPILAALMAGALPGTLIGYGLLQYLAGYSLALVQLLLGIAVAGSAVQLSFRPRVRPRPSPAAGMALAGLAGGVMGGLFATPGPPVVWQLYRQPMGEAAIRATLGALFTACLGLRLALAAADTGIGRDILIAAAGATPAVILGTALARRFPPPVRVQTMRRIALALLFLSGLALARPALALLMAA